MSNSFVLLYKLIESKKGVFYILLLLLVSAIVYCSSQLTMKDDITAFIPKNEKIKKYQSAIKNLAVNDRLIVTIRLKDSVLVSPDILANYADTFVTRLQEKYDSTWIKEIKYKIEDETALNVFDLLYSDLPYYLDTEDYLKIENQLADSAIYNRIKSNNETIHSSEGVVLKNYIIKDPLGLNNYALTKLNRLQSDDNVALYNGYFFTKDRKNLFIYISSAFSSTNSDKNIVLLNGLSEIITNLESSTNKDIKADFFGSPAVAVANSKQIKADSIFTTLVAVIVIFIGLFLYFRNLKTIFLIFLPVVFGAGFSLALVYLIRTEISAIAIGAGSIVLGIAIDYSLHFFTHLKHERSIQKVISDLTLPLTLGCATTIGAFLCLHYMQSEALQDMGLFAAFSLLGAALCCLIILPPLVKMDERKNSIENKITFLDAITTYPFHKSKVLLFLVFISTIVFAFQYSKVGFETDMTKLSYLSPELKEAENKLDEITNYKLNSVFLVSNGNTLDEALTINALTLPMILKLEDKKVVKKHTNCGEFLLTDSARVEKIKQWRLFWTSDKIDALRKRLYYYGNEFHFKKEAFETFLVLLSKDYSIKNDSSVKELRALFLKEYSPETEKGVAIITVLKVDRANKDQVYQAFEGVSGVYVLDSSSMASIVATILYEDFNLILILCSGLVFGFLLLSYGRIELAVLAFLPMLISWIWILGIMGLIGLKFNIVNIIVCTFIFGLGDDYSIFTVDGLEQQYKYGKNILSSYRNSIFLSAFTTIVGIGVLIFAQHPALKSIALVTIIGVSCIVFISLVVQPFLYELFILERKKKGKLPITIYTVLLGSTVVVYYILGSIVVNIIAFFKFKNIENNISKKFINSICAYILFCEMKFGDDWSGDFCRAFIGFIPSASLLSLENTYSEQRALLSSTDYFRGKLVKSYIFKGPVVEWYTRIKVKLENNYSVFDALIPSKGKIVDIGCGYGYLSYMLSLTSPERKIVGIDYDEEKIEIAKNSVLKTSKLDFFHSDVLDYTYEKSDAFIISDVLHYLKEDNQAVLIRKCLDNLNEGGILIIRDGNSELKQRHKGTKLTEFFSTKIVGFNKVTIDKLSFTSKEKILAIVADYNVSVEIIDTTQFTSNILFVIRKK